MPESKDSYIYKRLNENDEEIISFSCVDCISKVEENKILSFYPGSKEGYGPFLFLCSFCNAVLFDGQKQGEE